MLFITYSLWLKHTIVYSLPARTLTWLGRKKLIRKNILRSGNIIYGIRIPHTTNTNHLAYRAAARCAKWYPHRNYTMLCVASLLWVIIILTNGPLTVASRKLSLYAYILYIYMITQMKTEYMMCDDMIMVIIKAYARRICNKYEYIVVFLWLIFDFDLLLQRCVRVRRVARLIECRARHGHRLRARAIQPRTGKSVEYLIAWWFLLCFFFDARIRVNTLHGVGRSGSLVVKIYSNLAYTRIMRDETTYSRSYETICADAMQ